MWRCRDILTFSLQYVSTARDAESYISQNANKYSSISLDTPCLEMPNFKIDSPGIQRRLSVSIANPRRDS